MDGWMDGWIGIYILRTKEGFFLIMCVTKLIEYFRELERLFARAHTRLRDEG